MVNTWQFLSFLLLVSLVHKISALRKCRIRHHDCININFYVVRIQMYHVIRKVHEILSGKKAKRREKLAAAAEAASPRF